MTGDKFEKFVLNGYVIKSTDGRYRAVLSDDSIDREDEIVSKSFLEAALDAKVVGLMNHENDVRGLVCSWENKQIMKVNSHNSLVAEPKWFLANPNAKMLKNMLDEGADIGISIGAIPKKFDKVKIDDKEYRRWTEGEILEASFVAVPANKHAHIMAVAKSLKLNKEESTMTDENQGKDAEEEQGDAAAPAEGGDAEGKTAPDMTKPKQPSDNEDPKKNPKNKEGDEKSAPEEEKFIKIKESELDKLVEKKVSEKLDKQPVMKMLADEMELRQMDKKPDEIAAEASKQGKVPIVRY